MGKTIKKTELLYEPPPHVEDWFWDAFNRIVPDVIDAPKGTKKLRILWAADRLEYCAGTWERRYGDTDNNPPKYVGRCRWVIEGYQSPEVFNKDEWAKDAHLLGDYPSGGVWDFVAFHQDQATGAYLPLDQSALNHLELWAHWQGQGKQRSLELLMEQKLALREKRDAERREAGKAVALKFGEDVVKEFENATATAKAFSLPTGFTKTDSGLLIPQGN